MDVFSLVASIVLDTSGYEDGLEGASKKTSGFAEKLKSGLGTAAKVGAAALGVAATAAGALAKASLDSYADYEQLVGGVETLFDKSAGTVMRYAENAYKTAGLSANEYMETVTSFSASLLQSLGGNTEMAANIADMAITDMSDNANKMGTSMESIQNAYNGFAKANFTMLDNLKLGYGGTKEEMERLLADAEKLSGIKYDISSYADIVEAIHVVQTEMGITGTTALEASETISGSIASMKSAWANLVTGIADENANLGQLIGNVIESVVTVGSNIIPRVQQILSGITEAIQTAAPMIIDQVPMIVTEVVPSLLEAGVAFLDAILQGIVAALPGLANAALDIILTLSSGISDSLPELIPTIVDVVLQIVETLIDNADKLIEAAAQIIVGLAEGLINALPKLLEKAPEILVSLAAALIESVPIIIEAAIEIGANIISGIVKGVTDSAKDLVNSVVDSAKAAVNGVKDFLGIRSPSRVFAGIGENMALGLGEGWDGEFSKIKSDIENGMNFGTANIDFESSSLARSGQTVANGIMSAAASGGFQQDIVINLTSEIDGAVLAHKQVRLNQREEQRQGGSLTEMAYA